MTTIYKQSRIAVHSATGFNRGFKWKLTFENPLEVFLNEKSTMPLCAVAQAYKKSSQIAETGASAATSKLAFLTMHRKFSIANTDATI